VIKLIQERNEQRRIISIVIILKKRKTLMAVVLTQAAKISLGWIERQVYVT